MTFSSKLNWGSYIMSVAKRASKKIGVYEVPSPDFVLYLYKSTIQPRVEYCCDVWAGAPSCYLELLDKLQKRICRTVGASLNVSPVPTSVFFISITLVNVHLNWLNWFHFLILEGGWLVIPLVCMIFLSSFPDVTRMAMSTVSFLHS